MPGNQVIGRDVVLIGQEVVAEYLDVTSQAISNWYNRGLEGMPPYIPIHYTGEKTPAKVWRKAQLPAWGRWHEKHKAETGQHTTDRNRKQARAA
jgi:hypothetical protein